MKNIAAQQILSILFKNMDNKTRESAINGIFKESWKEYFTGTILERTTFIKYHKKSFHICLNDIKPPEFQLCKDDMIKLLKGITHEDIKAFIIQ